MGLKVTVDIDLKLGMTNLDLDSMLAKLSDKSEYEFNLYAITESEKDTVTLTFIAEEPSE